MTICCLPWKSCSENVLYRDPTQSVEYKYNLHVINKN